jgi:hypothetical protein
LNPAGWQRRPRPQNLFGARNQRASGGGFDSQDFTAAIPLSTIHAVANNGQSKMAKRIDHILTEPWTSASDFDNDFQMQMRRPVFITAIIR